MTVSHYWRGVWVSGQGEAEPRAARRLLIDLTPLRRSRDFRHLVWGELVSVLGNQLTTVAVPYQVYQLTHSSLDVGLVSVTQLFPLIAGSLLGGSAVRGVHGERHLPGAVPVRPGGGARAGRAAAGRGGRPLRVLAGRGRVRGGAVRRVPDLAAARPRARPPAGAALGHGGPALRTRQAG